MNRPLLFLERILYGDGSAPFNIVFAVRLTGAISYSDLRDALTKIQAKHPLLRSGIRLNDQKMPEFFLNGRVPEIPIRIVERKAPDDWITASKVAWKNVFNTRNGPMMAVTWIRSSDVSELLISLHHCMCDGGGLLLIAREMLELLDNPAAEIGVRQSYTTIQDIVPAEVLNNKKNLFKAQFSSTLVRTFMGWAGLFMKPAKKVDRNDDFLLSWKFSKADSSALFKACSAAGITVNTVVCSAFLHAFREVRKSKAHNKVICPVDIRRFTDAIDKDTIFSFGMALTLSLDTDPLLSFWDSTRLLHEVAARRIAEMNPYGYLMAMEKSHSGFETVRKVLTHGKIGNDLMFSNLGKLDLPLHYNSFDIETIYSPSVIGPFGNPTTVITSTFDNQIDFTFISNEAVLPEAEARAIRDHINLLLKRASSIAMSEPVLT
jgi:NRPS condensation-like uncharacterized protein